MTHWYWSRPTALRQNVRLTVLCAPLAVGTWTLVKFGYRPVFASVPVVPEELERLMGAVPVLTMHHRRLIWRVLFVSLHFKINYKILPPKLTTSMR